MGQRGCVDEGTASWQLLEYFRLLRVNPSSRMLLFASAPIAKPFTATMIFIVKVGRLGSCLDILQFLSSDLMILMTSSSLKPNSLASCLEYLNGEHVLVMNSSCGSFSEQYSICQDTNGERDPGIALSQDLLEFFQGPDVEAPSTLFVSLLVGKLSASSGIKPPGEEWWGCCQVTMRS